MLILRALERGLSLQDFEILTVGMVVGLITEYNNELLKDDEKEDVIREATQADFDRF